MKNILIILFVTSITLFSTITIAETPEKTTKDDLLVNELNGRLVALESKLEHLNSHYLENTILLNKLKDETSRHFINNFRTLLTLAFAVFGVAFTVVFKLLSSSISKRIRRDHEKMMRISSDTISARIYGSMGGNAINLYKDIDYKNHPKLYKSHRDIAVAISGFAYKSAKSLLNNNDINEYDRMFAICTNNKVFYLASRAEKADKLEADIPLRYLDRIAEQYEETKQERWWKYRDTLIWATVNFNYAPIDESMKDVNKMFKNPRIPLEWKESIHSRYEDYKTMNNLNFDIPQIPIVQD